MDWLINIFAFIVAILIIVGVHEFGHYWVARRCGVKILRFSIGFGKPLWSWRRGKDDTEYVIAAIPLGGYVSMFGEDDKTKKTMSEEDRKVAFNHKSLGARASIIAAGPAFNFILAIALYAMVFGLGQEGWRTQAHTVIDGSPAAVAGVQVGDDIVSVDGTEIKTWNQLALGLIQADTASDESMLGLSSDTAGERYVRLDLSGVNFTKDTSRSVEEAIGMYPWQPPVVVGLIRERSPASKSELKEGDKVLTLDGRPVRAWQDFVEIVRHRPNSVMPIVVERDGDKVAFELPVGERLNNSARVGYVGISPHYEAAEVAEHRTVARYGPIDSLTRAVGMVGDMTMMTLRIIVALIFGDAPLSNLSGPITIAQVAGSTFMVGLASFLSLLALVSLSIGIINLLPIPMLDGGHLLYCLIELVKGSPVSERARSYGHFVGLVAIGGLITIALYSDIYRLFG